MAKTYYIYEIPGVKVGCTTNMERRQREQRDKGEMILLESHTDINRASEREKELQLEKGYRLDSYYKASVLNAYKAAVASKAPQGLRNHKEALKKRDFQKEKLKYCKKVKAFKVIDGIKNPSGRGYRAITEKEHIGTYTSGNECARALGIQSACIFNVLNRPNSHQYKGYTFEYA